jgi:hypothetical protein
MADSIEIRSEQEARDVAIEFAILTAAIRDSQERREQLRQAMFRYMGSHALTFFYDHTSGLELELQTRQRRSWDVHAMPASLVLAVNSFSALRVDAKAARAVVVPVLSEMDAFAVFGDPIRALQIRRPPEFGTAG